MGWSNPALSDLVRGQGAKGWFGWYDSARTEALAEEWLYAPDEAAQKTAAATRGRLALADTASIPLGVFMIRTAYRKTLTGVQKGSAPYPWGLKRM